MKTWEKPQLIVLARGTPEESVLYNCKTMNWSKALPGPNNAAQITCGVRDDHDGSCAACQDRGIGTGS